jgi:hypothetical protein
MLWSLFYAIFATFPQKIGVFLTTQRFGPIFCQILQRFEPKSQY